MPWNPTQYLRFAEPRRRPALDLLARIPDLEPRTVVDLGCGTGALAGLLAERWPDAAVLGIDRSAEMLARARDDHPGIVWQEADLATWQPEAPVDVIYSNAALHWVGDHGVLLPRLMAALAPGGVLAVQMPRNFDAPSHTLIRELLAEPRWAGRVPARPAAVLDPADYHNLLTPHAAEVDLWETTYLHALTGAAPVLEWVRGTALVPVAEALSGAEFDAFTAEYRRRLALAYPPRPDGVTLFPFRRLFLVARRPAATG